MKDSTIARLPSQPLNLWPRDIFKVLIVPDSEMNLIKYFENAHGQLTSFIRHIGIKDTSYIIFCGRYAAHGG